VDVVKDASLNRLAFSATAHCLTGCAIGEVLGVVIGTALGWGDFATIALAIVLAFFFGYSLTMLPLLRSGMALGAVLPLAFARTRSRSRSWRSWTTSSCS
jgi:TctA family transporter